MKRQVCAIYTVLKRHDAVSGHHLEHRITLECIFFFFFIVFDSLKFECKEWYEEVFNEKRVVAVIAAATNHQRMSTNDQNESDKGYTHAHTHMNSIVFVHLWYSVKSLHSRQTDNEFSNAIMERKRGFIWSNGDAQCSLSVRVCVC